MLRTWFYPVFLHVGGILKVPVIKCPLNVGIHLLDFGKYYQYVWYVVKVAW